MKPLYNLLILSGLICFAAMITAGSVQAAEKIGIIDFQRVLKESSGGKLALKKVNTQNEQIAKKLETEKEGVLKLEEAFKTESLVMNETEKRKKERELRIRINDYKILQQDLTKKAKLFEVGLINQMQKEVFDIVQKIGKKEKFTLILEKKNAGVIFAGKNQDLTDQIIKEHNKQTGKQ